MSKVPPKIAVALSASAISAEAYLKIMRELGKTPREAIGLWAWATGISPVKVDEIIATVLREIPESMDAWNSIIASMSVNVMLNDHRPCECPAHTAENKSKKDPANRDRYYAEALLAVQKDVDPGIVLAELVKEAGLTDKQVAEIYKSFSTPPTPIDVIAQIIKTAKVHESKLERCTQNACSDTVN